MKVLLQRCIVGASINPAYLFNHCTFQIMVSTILKLQYLPIVTSSWFLITFIVCYFVSTRNGHVYPYIPYISDTGAYPPESCIFTQMTTIGVVFLFIMNYARYRQITFAIASKTIDLQQKWSTISFWSGNVFCIGLSVTFNFQETAVLSVHLLGAFVAFTAAGICLSVNTRITFAFEPFYKKNPEFDIGKTVVYLRLCLTVLYFLFLFMTTVCTAISLNYMEALEGRLTWWTAEHEGYKIHLAATVSEWLLVFALLLYLSTVKKEFKTLEFEEIRFKTKYVKNDDV